MAFHEIIGTLLTDDVISCEEATILLQPKSDDYEFEEERVVIVSGLLFGEIITPDEAVEILQGDPFYISDDPDDDMDDDFFKMDSFNIDDDLPIINLNFFSEN